MVEYSDIHAYEQANLLPEHSKDFQKEEFWTDFFKATQASTKEHFEWYASYEELKPFFTQAGLVPSTSNRILVPGCGDSLLSENLAKDLKQTKVTSIDFAPEIVDLMNKRGVEGVDYKVMDMLKMDFADDSFDIVLDKGSFDALCCDRTKETKKKTVNYLNEVCRVLISKDQAGNKNQNVSHYTIVSLLQDFVFGSLLNYFVIGDQNPHTEKYQFTMNLYMFSNVIKLS